MSVCHHEYGRTLHLIRPKVGSPLDFIRLDFKFEIGANLSTGKKIWDQEVDG